MLSLTLESHIPGKTVFLTETGPGSCNNIKSPSGINYVCLLLQLILVYTPCFVKSSEFSPVGEMDVETRFKEI